MGLGLSQIRELAVLILYMKEFNPDISIEDAMAYIFENKDEMGRPIEVQQVSQEELNAMKNQGLSLEETDGEKAERGRFQNVKQPKEVPDYLRTLVEGVENHQEEIDQVIDENIKGSWSTKRLEKINLEILRVAVYEILYTSDQMVPDVVAVDEAVELAKVYSDDHSRKFINGILSNIIQKKKDGKMAGQSGD